MQLLDRFEFQSSIPVSCNFLQKQEFSKNMREHEKARKAVRGWRGNLRRLCPGKAEDPTGPQAWDSPPCWGGGMLHAQVHSACNCEALASLRCHPWTKAELQSSRRKLPVIQEVAGHFSRSVYSDRMISAHSWPGPHLQPRARPSRWLGQGLQSEPGLVCSRGTPLLGPEHQASVPPPKLWLGQSDPEVSSTGPTGALVSNHSLQPAALSTTFFPQWCSRGSPTRSGAGASRQTLQQTLQ